ncbi:Ig-like domain-containing protein [Aquimarina sp. I32.4]|uniref:Ig-like domain-containing protein n=1 Tax=Aquimarina sp. I32.4 TaxID=2053903 RepID=UPI000CDE6D69|nr:Ig-like domain-containing protein [Aquimarina sp. I32.4]
MKPIPILKNLILNILLICFISVLTNLHAKEIHLLPSKNTFFTQDNCTTITAWSSDQIYTGGEIIKHNNSRYQAKWWNRNMNPSTNSQPYGAWESLGACSGGNNNIAPTVNITSPTNNSSFEEGTAITITANANDQDGSIAKVEFFNNNTLLGEDITTPYTFNINTPTVESYNLTAVATDNQGALTTSVSVSVMVTPVGTEGNTCNGLPQYVEGNPYDQGESVQNENMIYECKIAGWCSSSSGWAYAPGTGAHWEDAWVKTGNCGGSGGNTPPNVNITAPNNGTIYVLGDIITITANATDNDGTITKVEFFDGTTKLGEDTTLPYSFTLTTSTNGYSLTAIAIDDKGASTTSPIVSIRRDTGGGNGALPARILNGYWHNFQNGSGISKLRDINPNWDVINVSFAVPTVSSTDGHIGFQLDPVFNTINYSVADFKSDILLLQSQGKKVIISIGGAEGTVRLNSISARDKFTSSMISIIEEYGFDGMDIDFEGQSLSLDFGDNDFANPTTPVIVNTINAVKSICTHFGNDFILTMAPETFFVQLGYAFYGGISQGADRRAGAYLPLIHALRDKLTFLQVQYYNSGSITALDDQAYPMGNSDFYVSLVDMLLKGFPITKNQSYFFPPLRQDQILIGVPAFVQAGGGYTGPDGVIKAMDYLIKGTSFGGQYQLNQTYSNLRGVMSWSINWDEYDNFSFSTPVRIYLDGLQNRSPLGLQGNNESSNNINLYPNPITDNHLTVSIDTRINDSYFTLQIFNPTGVKVFEKTNVSLKKGSKTILTFDMSNLKSGLYLYNLLLDNKKTSGTLFIE